MSDGLFTADFKPTPYWWDNAPAADGSAGQPPARADVVVIGAGYTGLSAALELARAGRDVVVVDAQDPGFGCSTRNGGQIGPTIRNSFADLTARYGREKAYALKREGHATYAFLTSFIEREKIECSFRRDGHFTGAHNPAGYRRLEHLLATEPKEFEQAYLVPRAEQRREVGSDAFFGGMVHPESGSLDPRLYHSGLLRRVLDAGARVYGRQPATGIDGTRANFQVKLADGAIAARDVIVATNGYTGAATPWWQRRVIPIGSYIIATEPIAPALMQKLCPKGRMLHETRRVVYYYRPSPDNTRILFGGRVALRETDPRVSAPRLHAAMVRVFPELAMTKVSHSWMGFVAFTFDRLPHYGVADGVHYAMGYCGNGVPISTYLGFKLACKILGRAEGASDLEDQSFPTRPLYYGKPWFLAPSILYYKFRDRFLS